ncbi:MAG: energy transducer TonB [Acidobacteriia bacterium]|nr:energy transducer TonB [Terriglobia bacterium]
MFEDLVESGGATQKGKKPLTVFLSVAIHTVVIAVLVLIPLIYTEALPKQQLLTFLLTAPPPPPPPPPPPAATMVKVEKIVSQIDEGQLRAPKEIPKEIAKIVEDAPPPPSVGGVVGGVEGGSIGGSLQGVLGGIISKSAAPPPPPPKIEAPKPVQRIRVGGQVQAANLISAPKPSYPALAKSARIQGTVVLAAIISKQGTVENLTVVSGHPLLIQAALDAVRQWRYRPTVLNGEPVEVDTTITVNFSLTGG